MSTFGPKIPHFGKNSIGATDTARGSKRLKASLGCILKKGGHGCSLNKKSHISVKIGEFEDSTLLLYFPLLRQHVILIVLECEYAKKV